MPKQWFLDAKVCQLRRTCRGRQREGRSVRDRGKPSAGICASSVLLAFLSFDIETMCDHIKYVHLSINYIS